LTKSYEQTSTFFEPLENIFLYSYGCPPIQACSIFTKTNFPEPLQLINNINRLKNYEIALNVDVLSYFQK